MSGYSLPGSRGHTPDSALADTNRRWDHRHGKQEHHPAVSASPSWRYCRDGRSGQVGAETTFAGVRHRAGASPNTVRIPRNTVALLQKQPPSVGPRRAQSVTTLARLSLFRYRHREHSSKEPVMSTTARTRHSYRALRIATPAGLRRQAGRRPWSTRAIGYLGATAVVALLAGAAPPGGHVDQWQFACQVLPRAR